MSLDSVGRGAENEEQTHQRSTPYLCLRCQAATMIQVGKIWVPTMDERDRDRVKERHVAGIQRNSQNSSMDST